MLDPSDLETADPNTIGKYYETVNLEQEVACLMLSSMSPDLQKTLKKYNAYDLLKELRTMFEEQAKQELFKTVKVLVPSCYVLFDLEPLSLSFDLSLCPRSLNLYPSINSNSYRDVVILSAGGTTFGTSYEEVHSELKYDSMGKSILELHAMLKLYEKGISKKAETLAVLAIREGKIQKDKKKPQGAKGKDKGKNKLAYAPKPKISPPPKRDNPKKDSGLEGSKNLKHKALSLYVGNGMRTAIEAIGSFDLVLPSGLIIVLDNCHFAPTITSGVVSISCLVNNSYIYTFTNYGIFVLKDNVFYFNAIPRDSIYEIDMHNIYSIISSMFNVSNKRAKHAMDYSYLWHCRLGKKHMDKLQHDRILELTHDESLKKYDFSRYGYVYPMKHKHKVERTPCEIWHEKAPKLSYLRVWGCEALVKQDMLDKLDSRSIKFIFVGYTKETMGYYLYYPLENKIFIARNAKFFENRLMVQEASGSHGLLESSGSDEGLELIQEEDTQHSGNTSAVHNEVAPIEVEPQNVEVPIRRSTRIPPTLDRYSFYVDVEEY
uniref:Retroviral polymerase SH3-like domain-containing protein n=1 Tax=Tanacetum cinerariifolium TaxID=118510 RepID=A0A699GPJ1_TANCI|nr:hypothetical protein [Tanacetum cinerariifolium]